MAKKRVYGLAAFFHSRRVPAVAAAFIPALFFLALLILPGLGVSAEYLPVGAVHDAESIEARIEITNYPADMSVEKGWLKYVTLQVNNTGGRNLHRVSVDVEGIPQDWLEYRQATMGIDLLAAGASATFALKVTVPADARTQRYLVRFTAASDEASDEKISEMKVFGSRSEVMLQEMQTLKGKLAYLQEVANITEREGKDTAQVREKLDRASEILTVSESYFYKTMYDENLESLRGARKMLEMVESEIDKLPPAERHPLPAYKPPSIATIGMMALAALLGAGFMFFAFIWSVQKLIAHRGRAVEADYPGGRLSKKSYAKLKLEYEHKIAELTDRIVISGLALIVALATIAYALLGLEVVTILPPSPAVFRLIGTAAVILLVVIIATKTSLKFVGRHIVGFSSAISSFRAFRPLLLLRKAIKAPIPKPRKPSAFFADSAARLVSSLTSLGASLLSRFAPRPPVAARRMKKAGVARKAAGQKPAFLAMSVNAIKMARLLLWTVSAIMKKAAEKTRTFAFAAFRAAGGLSVRIYTGMAVTSVRECAKSVWRSRKMLLIAVTALVLLAGAVRRKEALEAILREFMALLNASALTAIHIHPAALVAILCAVAAFARLALAISKSGGRVLEGMAEPHWPRAAAIAIIVVLYSCLVMLVDYGSLTGDIWRSAVQFYPLVAVVAGALLVAAVMVSYLGKG